MRLMENLGIDNNADLVRYAIRHGLVGPRRFLRSFLALCRLLMPEGLAHVLAQ